MATPTLTPGGDVALSGVDKSRSVGRCRAPDLALELAPGRLPGSHLDDCAGDRPDVRLPPMPGLLDDLRGHPVWCPLNGLEARVCSDHRPMSEAALIV